MWQEQGLYLIAAILLGITAFFGIVMFVLRLMRITFSPVWALAHGAFATAALIVLAWAVVGMNPGGYALLSLVVAILAAIAGATLFFGFHLRGRRLPVALMLLHGLLALVAFVFLLIFIFF